MERAFHVGHSTTHKFTIGISHPDTYKLQNFIVLFV